MRCEAHSVPFRPCIHRMFTCSLVPLWRATRKMNLCFSLQPYPLVVPTEHVHLCTADVRLCTAAQRMIMFILLPTEQGNMRLIFCFRFFYRIKYNTNTAASYLFLCCMSSLMRLKYVEDKSTHACKRHSEHPMDTGSAQGQCTRPQGNTEQVNKCTSYGYRPIQQFAFLLLDYF